MVEKTALVERDARPGDLQQLRSLVGHEIKTPEEYADRMRAAQGQAHILSSMSAVAWIAPHHVINPMVVAIDPSTDPETGRGADCYHQKSIHKGTGRGDSYRAVEVSLNKNGLRKIMEAFGVDVSAPQIEYRERYWWIVTHTGEMLTFDGRFVKLPPGTASVDLRDGSADIDEWTPEAWAEAERIAAEQRKRVPEDERWKVKPAIVRADGSKSQWTRDRVMQQRKFGLELAETKSLNRLIRNLGIRQSYTVDELRRPFLIFRATFVPDLQNPIMAEMLAERHLGARRLLYPTAQTPARPEPPISHATGDPTGTFDGEVVHDDDASKTTETQTSAPPDDVTDAAFDETPDAPVMPSYVVDAVMKRGEGAGLQYFIKAHTLSEPTRDVTLFTTDRALAKACAMAAKDQRPRDITTERVQVSGEPYLQIVELVALGGLKL